MIKRGNYSVKLCFKGLVILDTSTIDRPKYEYNINRKFRFHATARTDEFAEVDAY